MKLPELQRRTLALVAVIAPLLLLLAYVALRSGPLAPVAVTAATVEVQAIQPKLFGIGTVEARYTYTIGPTTAGRLQRLDVHVGDRVSRGQVIGEMDPVDLDDRVRAQQAALKRAEAGLRESTARRDFAASQAQRYERLFAVGSTSQEQLTLKQQELRIAEAARAAAQEEIARIRSDRDAQRSQRDNQRLIAAVDGIVTAREVEPGSTVAAGQTVIELIDPASLWINVRFDQLSASGLAAELPARIALRSLDGKPAHGRVLRREPKADAVTEETLAKVVFASLPDPLPPIGELAEVTVDLPPLPSGPVIPNAAVRRRGAQIGVWRLRDGEPEFVAVQLGRTDLDGHVQVLAGIEAGDRIVVYSGKPLDEHSRIRLVERIPGVAQ